MQNRKISKLLFGVLCASALFLCFVATAMIFEFRLFPYYELRKPFIGLAALKERYFEQQPEGPYVSGLWRDDAPDGMGVTRYTPDRAYNGYTLYTSPHEQAASLIDMNGHAVHKWALSFGDVWPDPPHVFDPVEESRIYWRLAHVFPNGDLLALYVGHDDTPWGYGLVKMDKDSNMIWSYAGRTHHDFDIAKDGKIYLLTHEILTDPIDGISSIKPPYIQDYAVVLSPEGEELAKYPLYEAIRDSDYGRLFRLMRTLRARGNDGDFLHTNSIAAIERVHKGPDISFEPGQILLSFRNLDTIAVLDPKTGALSWALNGPWDAQHDADLLENGRILIFDNNGYIGAGGPSRVIEFDPFTEQVHWSYTGDRENHFESFVRSRQQRLPNGNTLITESDRGRLFEVTSDKEIVWEFFNPVRGGERNELIPVITGGQRVGVDQLTFL